MIIRMFCTAGQMWNVAADGNGAAYRHGSQVLDWLWQRLSRDASRWDIWMEVRVVGQPSICATDEDLEWAPQHEPCEYLARKLTRREAYDFIQPHIMMLGPL